MRPAQPSWPDPRLAQIARARNALLAGAPLPAPRDLAGRDWIWESWQRCLDRGGEPGRTVEFAPVSCAGSRDAQDANRELLAVADPILQRLARAIAPLRYFVLLTDVTGTVIGTAGVDSHLDADARALARVGVDLSEQSVGTTAISGALREQAPVWLHRGEHFFDNVGVFSCAGAPLWGPDGQCVGMVDLTGARAQERPELVHLVSAYAREVEHALLTATPYTLALRLAWASRWPLAEAPDHGLLCCDADGRIVGTDRVARQMLPQLQGTQPGGWHLKELFALPWPELFDLARTGGARTVPLWSGLHVHVTPLDAARSPPAAARTPAAQPESSVRPLRTVETELVFRAVREAGGRVDVAARALGISRATVYRRLRSGRAASAPTRQAGKHGS